MFFWSGHWHLRLPFFFFFSIDCFDSFFPCHNFICTFLFVFDQLHKLGRVQGIVPILETKEDFNLTLSTQTVSQKTNHKCSEMLKITTGSNITVSHTAQEVLHRLLSFQTNQFINKNNKNGAEEGTHWSIYHDIARNIANIADQKSQVGFFVVFAVDLDWFLK